MRKTSGLGAVETVGRNPQVGNGRRRTASPGDRLGAPPRRPTPHLFDCWERVAARLRAAPRLALFLDFDGTLVPLRPRPENARLEAPTRRVLAGLARHPRVTVWIISGRRLGDVRARARVPGVRYRGLHGWERDGGPGLLCGARMRLELAHELLAEQVRDLPGIWIEDKLLSLVVHYRGASREAVSRARPRLRKVVEAFRPHLRLMSGKKIWELLPKDLPGKGAAVREALAQLAAPALPLYVGDDSTDESAFAALRRGITVRVGSSPRSRARFYVRSPDEVREFLRRLESEIA